MANAYKNKVQLSDGTVLIDISDTTATASQVLNGSSFYLASGEKANGSVSFVTYYTGSSDPSASVGSDGDIYLKVVS